MDSLDSTSTKDDWPKKPIDIAPNDLAELLEVIWGIEKAKPKSPSKSSTSSPKKSPEKEVQEDKIKRYVQQFSSHLGSPVDFCKWLPPQWEPPGQKVNTKECAKFLRQVDKRIMEMKSGL
ncbi:hypothetical protein NCS56_01100900 [Fusarium sp. Ph1]|nr:hypothetical protein NCS56_01100900 [Fusarium sp. Ph1]